MSFVNRRHVLGLLGSTALAGCAAPAVVTRQGDPFEGGIGGTGIVGLLTDFGSLVVNGLRVELNRRTTIRTPYGRVSESAIRQGMPLTILASKSRDRLVARDVAISLPLVGELRRGASGLTVNGAPVRAEPGSLGTAAVGARVSVSGVWSTNGLVASRFDPAGDAEDLLAGVVGRTGPTGLSVAGVPVRLANASGLPVAGSYLNAFGSYDGTSFVAERTVGGRFGAVSIPLRQLSVEGFLEPVASNPGFRVAGLGHSFARDLELEALAARRAVYFGPYDGSFRAAKGYVVPEAFEARRQLLGAGFGDGFQGPVFPTR